MLEPNLKILVVDDDNISRRLLCKILQNCDFEPLAAKNSKEALQVLISDMEIDIVISDIMMPGDDGFEFKRQLQENPLFDDKKVLFCSSLRDPDTILKAKSLKSSGYLLKPFQEKYIRETLSKVIEELSPILEKKQTICKNLNMNESIYDTMLPDLLQEVRDQIEKMKNLESEQNWADLTQAMNSIHLNTTNLGAFRLQPIVEESLISLKNKQKEDIDVLIIKLEREVDRINLYCQRREQIHRDEIQKKFDREPDVRKKPPTPQELFGMNEVGVEKSKK